MSAKEKCAFKKDEYDLVAADGGWGYVICGAAVVMFAITTGFVPSFGLVYKDLIDEIELKSTEIAFINGLNGVFSAIAGFLTSCFLNYVTKRQLSFIAVAIFACGNIISVFTKSVIPLYIIFILQGCGFGILLNLTMAIINEYFVEKRLFAISAVQMLQAAIMMMIPLFVNLVHDMYGYTGTMLMISGVTFQGFVAAALMQPAEWHMKKVPKVQKVQELQVLLAEDDNVPQLGGEKLLAENPTQDDKKPSPIMKVFREIFDVPVLKEMVKTNVSWSVGLTAFTDLTFLLLAPPALYSYGWEEKYVAWAVTLFSFGDVAGRLFFTLFSKCVKLGSQELYIIGILINVLSKVGFLYSTSRTMTLAMMVASGFSRSFMVIFLPMIIAESVDTDKFPAAMGFVMVLMGASCLGLGSVVGAIRDYTDSYNFTFWVINGVNLFCVVSWTLELVYKRMKSKNKKEVLE